MIEASFATQYPQKDLYDDNMDYKEFCVLLSGLMPETPLGEIVKIRSEEDKGILKNFTKEQHRIRDKWRERQAQKLYENVDKEKAMEDIKQMFKNMFS